MARKITQGSNSAAPGPAYTDQDFTPDFVLPYPAELIINFFVIVLARLCGLGVYHVAWLIRVQTRLEESVKLRLTPWKGAIVQWVSGDWPDLTNRQLALLMIICIEPDRHFVRALAIRLAVDKAIISRVLDRLFDLGLLIRETDRRNRRNIFAVPTPRSFEFLTMFDRYLKIAAASSLRNDNDDELK